MRNFKNRTVSAVLGGVMTGGLLLLGGSPAAAASCPSAAEPVVPGAKAKWTVACSGGYLKIYGWVEDTRRDGKCAKVSVKPSNSDNWFSLASTVCGKGERTNFDYEYEGIRSAKVELSTF
ncbi:hypothetical protein [Streptomyces europaeiscabiei]|uniref:hypothetical protein n=1 Tax=Streptomyces europaeiscabiei TaxID=146819 RepID=UPI002E0D9CE3|nr:hypothetical protein OHB30_01775 [Streptomyces europaeiscabiei]